MWKDKIISEFSMRPFGGKGWMKGKLSCPECGKGDKFGTLFLDKGGVSRCFYCSTSFPINKVLRSIGRQDLLEFDFEYKPEAGLSSLRPEKADEIEKEVDLPIGFSKINYHPYLAERNFSSEDYFKFQVGMSNLDPKTEGKLVFLINQNHKLSGWLARSTETKEWHHENLRKHKEDGSPLVLRYRNSNNDFSKMLGGLDEITQNTHTLILVEGLFDKANLDRLLDLDNHAEIKCCYTFGSDLSESQVALIPDHIEEVVLMYDRGTIENMRTAGGRLLTNFNVKVALIEDEEIDPGNMDAKYLSKLLSKLQDFLYFYTQIHL